MVGVSDIFPKAPMALWSPARIPTILASNSAPLCVSHPFAGKACLWSGGSCLLFFTLDGDPRPAGISQELRSKPAVPMFEIPGNFTSQMSFDSGRRNIGIDGIDY